MIDCFIEERQAVIRFGNLILLVPVIVWMFCPVHLAAQSPTERKQSPTEKTRTDPDQSRLTIDRIYQGDQWKAQSFSAHWLSGLAAIYTTVEPSQQISGGQDIVRHDPATGKSEVMVAASELVPAGETAPLKIAAHRWSADHNWLLIYTNTKRVWRQNTRGDYWLLDRSGRQLRKLGGDAPPASLMFAKLSPTGKHVAYVRDRDLYVEDVYGGAKMYSLDDLKPYFD